jgi:ADP-heptose:LPS heptosyltransferase
VVSSRYPFQKSWKWILVSALDRILDRVVQVPKDDSFPEHPKKILFLRLDHIGDIICSLPAISIIRKKYPDAHISILVSLEGEALLRHSPFVDEVLVFRSNWFSRTTVLDMDEYFQILSLLRNRRFDIGFDLRGDLRNILLLSLARVRYRVGYEIAGGGALLHDVPLYDSLAHQVELNRNLVTKDNIPIDKLNAEIHLSRLEKNEAQSILKKRNVPDSRLIAIHPEAGYSSKEWEKDHFVNLIRKIELETSACVLIFGIHRGHEIAEHFQNSGRVFNFVGTLDLREMISVLSFCHIFIGNDSGPSHLARALGLHSIVLSSGTNEYAKWGLWDESSVILRHLVSCAPCHLSVCPIPEHPCMSNISVEDVFNALSRALGGVHV